MDIFRPELSAFPLVAFIDEARQSMGDAEVDRLVADYQLTTDQLLDKRAWVSLEFVEAFLNEMARRSGASDFIERATRRGMSPKYIGPLYPLLFALNSPVFTYGRIVAGSAHFNKTGVWHLEEARPGYVRMSWHQTNGGPRESTRIICRTREIQMRQVPVLFDRAPARVKHDNCLHTGGNACTYEMSWVDPPPRLHGRYGLGAGMAAGALLGTLAAAPIWLTAVTSLGFGVCGWSLGRMYVMRGDLGQRIEELTARDQALDEVIVANALRYEELAEAKAEVDRKVEEATQQLSETLEEVRAMDRAKTEFFNNVSHELRSPLTLILAPLEDLVEGRTPPGGQEAALATMKRNAARLLHLINQLLDLAKLDAGQVQIAPAPTSITTLVEGVTRGFESAAHAKGVRIAVEAPGQMRDVAVDARWIESAIGNLVGNALKFTERGGEVRIVMEDGDAAVTVAVSDDGPGIAPEDHARVFERFGQTDISANVVGGTGIGLALVREAARLHDGDVTLDSQLGEGATFTLTLPRTQTAQPAPADVEPTAPQQELGAGLLQPAATGEALQHDGPSTEAPLALVVEDNPDLRHFMVNTLGADYRVRAARNGKDGLALALSLSPDVIVSDVAMPEMDGFELCRALRAHEKTRSTPVLIVTARTDVSSVLEGFDAGASDYVLKPFHGRELLARVDVHVRLRRLAEELALRERHAMLGVIAASVAHQVRNPLTTLVSGLPAMRARLGDTLDGSSSEMMDVMIDCSRRIEELTTDLMDISRVDRAEGGDFQPSDGLRAAIRLVRARLPPSVELEEAVDDAALIHGRPGDMNQVFLNLLDNAVRAVGGTGRIRVRGACEPDGHYVVTIGDSGAGMDEETAARVFEPFYTTRPAGEGTGLGLAIAAQVVERHGGRIQVGSCDLGGAEFTVRIPETPPSIRPPAPGPEAAQAPAK